MLHVTYLFFKMQIYDFYSTWYKTVLDLRFKTLCGGNNNVMDIALYGFNN